MNRQSFERVYGRSIDLDWRPEDDDVLDRLRGQKRVWALSSDGDFDRRLDARGRQVEALGNPEDVALYLYDFSPRP